MLFNKQPYVGQKKASLSLRFGAAFGILYLNVPLFFIILYAFTTEDKSYQFPPPGYTLKWFKIVLGREDIWNAVQLSLKIACLSTLIAIVFGTLAAAALYKRSFFGRETITLLIILPIALPGIITGISLRSAYGFAGIPYPDGDSLLGRVRDQMFDS